MISSSSLTVSDDRFGAWVCGDRQVMAAPPGYAERTADWRKGCDRYPRLPDPVWH
ncbi:MAG: hypothetical protein CM15mP74_09320 [Halieaceae bacterium]|nr:MAG: hypothetical protein CM15mP74_09320 [Halieaceae bacterium]